MCYFGVGDDSVIMKFKLVMKNINRQNSTKPKSDKSQEDRHIQSQTESRATNVINSEDFMEELVEAYVCYKNDGSFTLKEFRETRGIA